MGWLEGKREVVTNVSFGSKKHRHKKDDPTVFDLVQNHTDQPTKLTMLRCQRRLGTSASKLIRRNDPPHDSVNRQNCLSKTNLHQHHQHHRQLHQLQQLQKINNNQQSNCSGHGQHIKQFPIFPSPYEVSLRLSTLFVLVCSFLCYK